MVDGDDGRLLRSKQRLKRRDFGCGRARGPDWGVQSILPILDCIGANAVSRGCSTLHDGMSGTSGLNGLAGRGGAASRAAARARDRSAP